MNVKNESLKINSTASVAVTTTATLSTFTSAYVKNIGTVTVYVGTTNAVTTLTGYPILEGEEILITGKVYLIAESATSVRVAEVQ